MKWHSAIRDHRTALTTAATDLHGLTPAPGRVGALRTSAPNDTLHLHRLGDQVEVRYMIICIVWGTSRTSLWSARGVPDPHLDQHFRNRRT